MAGDTLDGLAHDLGVEADTILDRVRPVIAKAAVNIKQQLRDEMGASVHFRKAAHKISYETVELAGAVEARIGPTHGAGDPGSIANVAYFGGARGGGRTVPDPKIAAEAEIPATIDWLGRVTGEKVARL